MLGTAELPEGDHHQSSSEVKRQNTFPAVGAQSSVPVGVTESEKTVPEECQKAGPTPLDGK